MSDFYQNSKNVWQPKECEFKILAYDAKGKKKTVQTKTYDMKSHIDSNSAQIVLDMGKGYFLTFIMNIKSKCETSDFRKKLSQSVFVEANPGMFEELKSSDPNIDSGITQIVFE